MSNSRAFYRSTLVLVLALLLPEALPGQTRPGGSWQASSKAHAQRLASRSNPAVNVSPGAWSQLGQLVPSTSNGFYAIAWRMEQYGEQHGAYRFGRSAL